MQTLQGPPVAMNSVGGIDDAIIDAKVQNWTDGLAIQIAATRACTDAVQVNNL